MEKNLKKMIDDYDHWHNRKPPFCPNEHEIKLYKDLIGNSKPVYLLGLTSELIDFCDFAVDLHKSDLKKSICLDWFQLDNINAGAIIGDGVLNITDFSLVEKMSKLTKKLILRVFLKKLEWMKYANFFPKEFPGAKIIETQPDIAIVYWEFQ
jgi:hypothetical protein